MLRSRSLNCHVCTTSIRTASSLGYRLSIPAQCVGMNYPLTYRLVSLMTFPNQSSPLLYYIFPLFFLSFFFDQLRNSLTNVSLSSSAIHLHFRTNLSTSCHSTTYTCLRLHSSDFSYPSASRHSLSSPPRSPSLLHPSFLLLLLYRIQPTLHSRG